MPNHQCVHLLPLLVLFAQALTAAYGQSVSQAIPDDIRASLEAINKKMELAVLAGSYETQASMFTDDMIIDTPFDPPIRGKNAFLAQGQRARREGMKYHSFSGTVEDIWMCGDKVYERGTWGMSFTTTAQQHPLAYHGSYYKVFQDPVPDLHAGLQSVRVW